MMIYSYGVSTVGGTYHKKNNIPCQDFHHVVKCGDDIAIAAVADGCGSAAHSEIASKIAAMESVKYCAEKIVDLSIAEDILRIIKESFVLAQNTIEKKAQDNGHSINDYDTTLSLAILCKDKLCYGHSGDSGIIALTVDGRYEQVTEQQRDENNGVFYLFFKERWVFQRYEKKVCSVLLATDGMLDSFFPIYIKDKPVSIRVNLARFFMDNKVLRIDEAGEDKVQTRMVDFISNISDEEVNDDKTILVMVNASIESSLQPEEYYIEPDWDELQRQFKEEWKRKAYPHLYKTKEAVTTKDALPPADVQGISHLDETTQKTDVAGKKESNSRHKSVIEKAIEFFTGKR